MKKITTALGILFFANTFCYGQYNGLTDMSKSKMAKMVNTPIGSVHWTGGFWNNRFQVLNQTSIWDMWNTWNDPNVSHGFRNFEIAAGDVE